MTGPAVAVNPFTPEPGPDENPFTPEGVAVAPKPTLRKLSVPMASADVTRVGPGAPNPQAVDLTKGNVAERTVGALTSMAAHPISTAAGIVTAPFKAARTAAQFMGQSAAEVSLPPDIAARALADPERISEKDALLAGAQLAVPAAGGRLIGAMASPIAKAMATTATGAATGAVYAPEDPVVGAIIGGGAGAAASVGKLRTPAAAPLTPAASTAATFAKGKPIDMYEPNFYDFGPEQPLAPSAASAPAGLEERAAGLSVPGEVRKAVGTAVSQAVTDPYAPISAEHPALSDALKSASAMTRPKAEAFVRQMGERVVSDLTPVQREQFETARVAANLEAEASRKANGAASLSAQAVAHRMQARNSAAADLTAQLAKADQVYQGGLARAQSAAAVGAPGPEVNDLLESAQIDADEIRKPAQADHDLAVKMGDKAHDEAQKEAFAKSQAAARATEEAAAMRAKVPKGVEDQPWFQQALAKHQAMVEPFNAAAAVRAGVAPESFRSTDVGYARLTPQEQINEQLIQRTQETAADRGTGAVTPRTGKTLRVLGQKPSVTPLLPAGAEAPLQGPANTLRQTASGVSAPTAATLESGSAKAFKGASGYSTDYLTNIARDAGDKVTKAAKNQVYQALAADAMRNGSGVRKLLPEENAAPGERMIAFNDQKDIIQPPSKDDPNYQVVQRFAVPPDVADAFSRYQQRSGPASNLAKGAHVANRVIMRSVLSNPLVAAGHTLTEGSNVSRGLPAEEPTAVRAITGLPVIKSADAIRRALSVDMEAPETTTRLQRLALSGALRIGEERGQGWVDAAHHALFGPNGIDTRMRLVASRDAEAAWTKAGGSLTDPAFTGWERDYVTGHSGNYVSKNQGTAIQALNQSGLAPFIAIGRAKLGGALQGITGADGPPSEGFGARLLRIQRGPLGQAAAVAGAGYLLSGHGSTSNAPGHETDMATGVYHLPDGSFKYFRGDPDQALATFGNQAKEVYLRKGFMDPSSAAALRLLEPIAYAKKGDRVSESVRAAANTAMAFAGPAPALTTQLVTGHELYLDKDGALGSVQGVHLSKDADLTDRLVGAARNLNAGVAIGMAPPTQGARSAANAFLGNLNPFTQAKPGTAPRVAAERRDEGAWQDAKVKEIFGERDPAKRQQIVQDAIQEAAESGFTGPKLRATLVKAAARANIDRSASSAIKFQNQIRGGAPAPQAGNPFAKQP